MTTPTESLRLAREVITARDRYGWSPEADDAINKLRAALAQQPSAPSAEPLKGWKLNHVQYVRGSGTAQIGYLDPEDGRFSPIVTVDTGLYYQNDQAAPLAIAILGAIADAARSPAEPAAPMARPEHVPAGPEIDASVDDKLGLVLLPPIRVDRATHAALLESAKARGLIVQAVVRERLAPYATPAAQPDSKGQQ